MIRSDGWSPYMAGALVGLLAALSLLVTTLVIDKGHFLGASTTFVRAAGLVEQTIAPEHVAANEYMLKTKVKIDWQMMFVAGIFIGALVASRTDKSYRLETVPPIWADRFGHNATVRAIAAFGGGIIAMFGVRMAGGCPSGHGLSGMMQLATSSTVAMIFFLIGGIISARLIYTEGK